MASDAAPSATDSPSLVTLAHATAAPPSASASTPVDSPKQPVARADPAPPSTKRPREDSPAVPTSPSSAAHFQRDYSPTKIARLGLTAQLSPPFQLTGAAAIAEERRRREEEQRRNPPGVSENPNHKALSELMSGATMTVSRPQDAPPAMDEIALAAEATKALGPVTIPQPNVSDARTDISPPHSASSAGGAADSHALMNSPGPMDVDQRSDRQSYASQPEAQMDEKTATSLSYPGILSPNAATQAPAPPPRPSSLPHGADHTPSSSKKHKCPYCDTEFTRHHNLKSHLLTHSQEKPYLCKDCGLRFRRLHDLKRHGKLHTGEKNHECPKCGRKFARGDALARHSKGAGGCAGRRASMGSYGEQGDFEGMSRNEGDESMVGISYDENGDVDMVDDERRRQSLPAAVKGHHATGSEGLVSNSRTYPPAGGAARGGAPSILYPPNNSSAAVPAGIANSISGITESPKPLSPLIQDQTRQRSPGLAAQFQHPQQQQQQQQQQYGRSQSDRDIHPLPALPPPHSTINPLVHVIRLHQPANGPQGQPPQPPGLAPGNTNINNNNNNSNTTSHSRTAAHAHGGDNTSANLFAQADQGMWAYMQQLEDKVKEMGERLLSFESLSNAREARLASMESTLAQRDAKINSMEVEIAGLRKELVEKP